jgi:putative hydrolase of the HAD superfamily
MQTLFFDFGNVIGFFDHRVAVRKFIHHCDLDEAACFAAVYNTVNEDDFEAGRLRGDEFVKRACAAISYRGTPDEFRTAFQDIFVPNQDVCALVPRLAGRYRLVLASNTNELHAVRFREQFADVLKHFAALGMSHEAGARKPQRGFFEHCQRFADCPPHECLFIDDLPANLEGARAFGWNTVRYTSFPDLLQQLRSYGIET